jgi:hypothetical protein
MASTSVPPQEIMTAISEFIDRYNSQTFDSPTFKDDRASLYDSLLGALSGHSNYSNPVTEKTILYAFMTLAKLNINFSQDNSGNEQFVAWKTFDELLYTQVTNIANPATTAIQNSG